MKNLILFVCLSLAALCSQAMAQSPAASPAAQPSPTPVVTAAANDQVATLIFYRYKAFAGSALEPGVFCDEVEIAKMDNGRWFKALIAPGKHVIQSNDKQAGIELDLKAGEEYYIRVDLVTGFWKGHGRVLLVPKEQGAFEVKKLKPLGKDKVRDAKRVVIE